MKTITFDKDTIVTLVGRFILAPLIMFLVLKFFAPNMATVEFKTFMIQSATPALAVLPILANQGKGDVEFSTNGDSKYGSIYRCYSNITNFVRIRRKRIGLKVLR